MPFITARVVSVVIDDAIAALADAGQDQSVLCAALVQLEASIVGDDIANHTFEWEQTFGTPVTLINANTLTPSFVNPQVSDLEFTFYLDRNTPFEDSDIVIVSRAPQDQVTAFGSDGGAISRTGTATTESNISGTSQELINEDAHVTGWGFTNPPTARYNPIFEASDLDRARENLAGDYWLMKDIDLSGYSNWDPLGSAETPFTGDFQGNGFVIDNLSITNRSRDSGLFGTISGATIEDLSITNANVTGQTSSFYSGILAGAVSATNASTIKNCLTSGSVASEGDRAGGFIGNTGTNVSTLFENTYADVTVTGGGTRTGGWAGLFETEAQYTENYSNTTKTAAIVGSAGDTPIAGEVEGRTTAQLNAEANYTNWDFTDTWQIDEGVSPATLQRDRTYVRDTAIPCDDEWMIAWSNPTVLSSNVLAPLYTYKGVIIEEAVSSGWGFPRFIPKNRHGGLMTPATTHRITSIWDFAIAGSVRRPTDRGQPREIRIVNDKKFTSRGTSPNFGPYGNGSITSAWGGANSSTSTNFVLTISNPRKISMQQDESGTYGLGGDAAVDANSVILRAQGVEAPEQSDSITTGYGSDSGLALNLVITRANGIGIG